MHILKRLFGFDNPSPEPPAPVADDALAAARDATEAAIAALRRKQEEERRRAEEARRKREEAFDSRAFSRRIVQGVKDVYGGNPVPFYTAAGLSRSAYSKLISHPDRHPAKDTVLAMAAAFKMPLADAESFLRLAGYALSDSVPADLVWRACFAGGVHHLPQIRQLLAEFAGR